MKMINAYTLFPLILGVIMLVQYVIILSEGWKFKRLIKNQVSLGLVFGSLGQGKSLLFSWLVSRLNPTYTNFWHAKKGNKILKLDYLDVRGKSKIPTKRAYYFLDEVNLSFRGVEYQKNRSLYPGIEDFCALARHFSKTVLFSVQRPNQLWNAIREIANVYIKVKGISKPFWLPWKRVLNIEIYEDLKLAEEWDANMQPYQKRSGFLWLWSDNDYNEAKKRLNVKNYRLFLNKQDFTSYDTTFFSALLPLLNKDRPKITVPTGKIPVPKTLKDVIKQDYFIKNQTTKKDDKEKE